MKRIEAVDVGIALQDLHSDRGGEDGEIAGGKRFPDRFDSRGGPEGVSERRRGDDQDPLCLRRVRRRGAKGDESFLKKSVFEVHYQNMIRRIELLGNSGLKPQKVAKRAP